MMRLAVVGLVLAVLSLSASGCCSCCNIAVDLDPPEGEERDDPPPPDADELDLGTAYHPKQNRAEPAVHPWWLKELDPQRYRLTYRITERASEAIQDDYDDFARKVGHKRIDSDRFQWQPSARCVGGLQCVYEELEDGSEDGVAPIAELFRKRAKEAKLSADKLAALVITFVQEIEYKIPDGEPFGVMPPALVVEKKWGDCDSKSLLAHMLLRELGLRSVLISSEAHKHTMLGIALPAPGQNFSWQGTKYAFVELTAKRSPIGHIDPQLIHPSDWRVVPMRYKEPGAAAARDAGPTAMLSPR